MSMQPVNSDTFSTPQEEPLIPEMGQEQPQHKLFMLLNEVSPEVQQKINLIDAIVRTPGRAARRQAIEEAAKKLGKSIRTIKRIVKRLETEGVATLGVGRKDKGQFRISEQWFKIQGN